MRRPGARRWSANGKPASWKSATVAGDYVTRKSRHPRPFNRRPRQPSGSSRDGRWRRRRPATHGEKTIDESDREGGSRNEERAVEMAERWKVWKSKNRISPLSTVPWKSRKEREISTFPQLRRLGRGKVENQEQVSHFPTAIYYQVDEKRPTASPKKRGHFYRGTDGDISNEA